MSIDVSLHLDSGTAEGRAVETVMRRFGVGAEQAVVSILRNAGDAVTDLPSMERSEHSEGALVKPLSEPELAELDELYPAFKLLENVTDEQWDVVLEGARRMNRRGFPKRA